MKTILLTIALVTGMAASAQFVRKVRISMEVRDSYIRARIPYYVPDPKPIHIGIPDVVVLDKTDVFKELVYVIPGANMLYRVKDDDFEYVGIVTSSGYTYMYAKEKLWNHKDVEVFRSIRK